MKEASERKSDNSSGVVGVVLGIFSIVALLVPVLALVLAIIGFVFSWNQKKNNHNSWSKAGLWLCGIGIILGVAWNIYYIVGIVRFAAQYQEQIQGLQGLSQQAGAIDPSAYANYGN